MDEDLDKADQISLLGSRDQLNLTSTTLCLFSIGGRPNIPLKIVQILFVQTGRKYSV